jgi:hypothetical protein
MKKETSLYWTVASHDEDQLRQYGGWPLYEEPWAAVFKSPEGKVIRDQRYGIWVAGFGGLGGNRDRKWRDQYRAAISAHCCNRRGVGVVISAAAGPTGRHLWRTLAPCASFVALGGLTGRSTLDRREPRQLNDEQVVCIQGQPFKSEHRDHLECFPIICAALDLDTGEIRARRVHPETLEEWVSA